MHQLLEHQTKRFLRENPLPPLGWDTFLASVEDAYSSVDAMLAHKVEETLERDIDKREMVEELLSNTIPSKMNISTFLVYAMKLALEIEAAYLKSAEFMTARGSYDVAEFFREMAGFSCMHRDAAMRRAGFDDSIDIYSIISSWSGCNIEVPDPDMKDSESPLDLDGAMSLSLAAERRGVTFYEEIARITTDMQIRLHAEEFAAEGRGHVLALERFLGLEPY